MWFHTMKCFKSNKDVVKNQEIYFGKPDWCSIIIFGKIFFNLFASTLEKILYRTLHRLIGRYSWTYLGFVIFWMRVMKVWLIGCERVPELNQGRIELTTSRSTTYQKNFGRKVEVSHKVQVLLMVPFASRPWPLHSPENFLLAYY